MSNSFYEAAKEEFSLTDRKYLVKNYTEGQDALPDEKTERTGTVLEKTAEMR